MFKVKCPKCGGLSKSFDKNKELKGRCSHCGATISITETRDINTQTNIPSPHTVENSSKMSDEQTNVKNGMLRFKKLFNKCLSSVLSSALIAIGITYLFYLLILPIMPESVVKLTANRGQVPYVEVYFAFWLISILSIKELKSRQQSLWIRKKSKNIVEILRNPKKKENNIATIIARLENRKELPQDSILVERVLMALRHFRSVYQVGEVRDALTARSAIEANRLEASYVIPRVLIWAIPILGFLGTVYGMSAAIGQFSGLLPNIGESAKEVSAMRETLSKVTGGLSIAFDTTLLALCLVLPLMLLTSWLHKAEETFLLKVDTFCNEEVTKWLFEYKKSNMSLDPMKDTKEVSRQ